MTAKEIKVGDKIGGLTVRSVWPDKKGIRVLFWELPDPVYYQPEEEVKP